MTYELRDYQQESVDAVLNYWRDGGGNPLLVLPVAAGKSLVLAELCKRILKASPGARIGMFTHVKELVQQNAEEILRHWPQAPLGIYSAALGKRDRRSQILYGSIQSVYNKIHLTGGFHVVLVDEAHLVPFGDKPDTQYHKFFAANREIVPKSRICGLTGTAYRLKGGLLHKHEHALFDDIAYEVGIGDMIDRGFLVPPINAKLDTRLSNVGATVSSATGDYTIGSIQKAVNTASNNDAATNEIVEALQHRNQGMAFCTGVEHGLEITRLLREKGVSAEFICGNTKTTTKADRDSIIRRFKAGKFQMLVNVEVLTAGFNHPPVDLIAVLRPTKSPALWIQILGRGLRLSPAKADCLVLDFTSNSEELGPIDAIIPPPTPKKRRKADDDIIEAMLKTCPVCETPLHLSVKECPECGHIFPGGDEKINEQSSDAPLLSSQNIPIWLPITSIYVTQHSKPEKPDSVRVDYYEGKKIVASDFLCLGHRGMPRDLGREKWSALCGTGEPPADALEGMYRQAEIRQPHAIRVEKRGKYMDVKEYSFKPIGAMV